MDDHATSSLPQIHLRIALLESELERARAQKADLEARGEVLLGRFMMEQIRKTRGNVAMYETLQLTIGGTRFSDWLTRDEDRQLFGLHDQTSAPQSLEVSSQAASIDVRPNLDRES